MVTQGKMARWICFYAVFCFTWPEGQTEIVFGKETEDFDFDGLPGSQHEFRIDVGAGRDDCYYQKVTEGSNIYVSFEVLRGGDGEISLMLYDPEVHSLIQTTERGPRGGFQYQATRTATYALCLDNSHSMMASKLVYFYLVTYLDKDWTQYQEEIEEVFETVGNFSTSVNQVQESITAALVHQAESRMHVLRDWYLVTDNNKYIQWWSMLQCFVVICASGFQVFFLRRLFRTKVITPSNKPRA